MNLAAIASFLERQLGSMLTAAFIYGSVAADRAGPYSDIDCFVITARDLSPEQRHLLGNEFATLQCSLGYVPDPDYPIELFSVGACVAALESEPLHRALAGAAGGQLDPSVATSDEVEVLGALLDRRMVIRPSPVLDELTARARSVLERHAEHQASLMAILGLAHDRTGS
ncbi:nucleotidyltransferase domain-containing protein [Micromonospora sp. DT48]|uniref:nucleotidyltransferase domain-containing protein n=1 Tax=Micromonospora sp. DT48 TaxID=3393429 RepID=UPI003CF83032